MVVRSRRALLFPVAILVLVSMIVLKSGHWASPFPQLTSPTEVVDDVFISLQIDDGETKLRIDNQSEYYFQTGLPDYADLEVYDYGKWTPIPSKGLSLLMAVIVPPNTTYCETPYWSEWTASLESGFYRVKFSGMSLQTTLSSESILDTIPDTFVPYNIP